jgi:hypothetical protein
VSASYDSDIWLRGLEYSETARARVRRKRFIRRAWYVIAVAGSCLLMWAAVSMMCGYQP